MFEDWDWNEMVGRLIRWAATSPWEFIYYVLLCLSPFFFVSAILAWQLAKQIEHKEKRKKKTNKKESNVAKTRRQKAD
uniref:Small integral membrane protein 15 n=1 Tax=Octopus bimaculoides TaxID=37653 RepID=A0A0L8GTY0_OCTBM